MYNQNQFLANNAKTALENHRREQEERKIAMIREQKTRELQQLETQLFYKKSEVERLKALANRLRREAVVRQNTELKEEHELQVQDHNLKDAESRIKKLEEDIKHSLSDIAEKISKEKTIIMEHQKNLEQLEKQKREFEGKGEFQKRSITESISRILFFKKKEERESQHAKHIFETGQNQLQQIEQSLKTFSQEVTVLENKIRALRSVLK